MRTIIILFFLCLVQPVIAFAQQSDSLEGMVDHSIDIESSATDETTTDVVPTTKLRIENEFWYIVLLSGLCISSLTIILSFLKHKDHSAKDIVNAAGLTLIIFGTIILVMVVSTSEQLTAAIGILGAIAGYLFRSVQDQDGQKKSDA